MHVVGIIGASCRPMTGVTWLEFMFWQRRQGQSAPPWQTTWLWYVVFCHILSNSSL